GFVARLTETGETDSDNFATNSSLGSGIYILDAISGSMESPTKMNIVLQPDNKIVGTGPGEDTNNEDVFVGFRLNANGTPDVEFNTNATNAFDFIDAESMTVHLRRDGKILFGGSKDSSTIEGCYTFVQLKSDGTLDQTFNKTGQLIISQGFPIEAVVNINEDDNGSVVATVVGTNSEYAFYTMTMRITSSGTLDKTFYSNGRLILTKCFPRVSIVDNGSLYIFGQRN